MSTQDYEQKYGPIHVMYGGPIQDATRSGDAERMRQMEQLASQYVSEVRAALDELRGKLQNS